MPLAECTAGAVLTAQPDGSPFVQQTSESKRRGGEARGIKSASEKGAEASLTFQGTGVIVSGAYLNTGGTADVYLDGKLDRTVDAYSDGEGQRRGESLWHMTNLKNGKHTVRVVVRGEPFRDSKGSEISIDDAILFR